LILWAGAVVVNIGGEEGPVQSPKTNFTALSFRSAALSREESAVLLPAASGFPAKKAGSE